MLDDPVEECSRDGAVTSGGFAQVFLISRSGVHPVGVPMRFRALLAADYINAASASGWAYLKFTN